MKLFCVALLFVLPIAHGHNIRIFAAYEGTVLKGRAYSGRTGIANVKIQLLNPDETERSTVTTDADGNFSKEMSEQVPLKLQLKLADGHTATYELNWDRAEESAHPHSHAQRDAHRRTGDSDRELARLREQLIALESRSRLRDVLGGIGFVFGLAGILMMIKSRKRNGAVGVKDQ